MNLRNRIAYRFDIHFWNGANRINITAKRINSLSGECFIKDKPQGIDVGSMVNRFS